MSMRTFNLLCPLYIDFLLFITISKQIKLMRFSCYDWSPQRFHPQFSGIAQRHAEHKKRRLAFQQRRKQLNSDKAYSIKLIYQIQKELYSKTLQLSKLKEAKQRHIQDLNFKQRLCEKRQQEIQSLRNSNQRQRSLLKTNIALARKNLQIRNEQKRIKLQQQSKINSSKLQALLQQRHESKKMKCQKVKLEEEMAESNISKFHREKNKKSYVDYCERIGHERKVKNNERRKIMRYERQIAQMNERAQIKKKKLCYLEQQISVISSQSRTLSTTIKFNPKRRQHTSVSQYSLANRVHSNISFNSNVDPEHTIHFRK